MNHETPKKPFQRMFFSYATALPAVTACIVLALTAQKILIPEKRPAVKTPRTIKSSPARSEHNPSAKIVRSDTEKIDPNELTRSALRIVNHTQRFDGSGTIIGQSGPTLFILTAYHVVRDAERLEIMLQLPVTGSEARPFSTFDRVEVIARSIDDDLALLNASAPEIEITPAKIGPLEMNRKPPFPAFSVGWSRSQGPLAKATEVVGISQAALKQSQQATLSWLTVGESIKGQSGGGLFDSSGRLIGTATGTTDDRAYFTHVARIHELLSRGDLAWLLNAER